MNPAEPPAHADDKECERNFKEAWRLLREMEAKIDELEQRVQRAESIAGAARIGAT